MQLIQEQVLPKPFQKAFKFIPLDVKVKHLFIVHASILHVAIARSKSLIFLKSSQILKQFWEKSYLYKCIKMLCYFCHNTFFSELFQYLTAFQKNSKTWNELSFIISIGAKINQIGSPMKYIVLVVLDLLEFTEMVAVLDH